MSKETYFSLPLMNMNMNVNIILLTQHQTQSVAEGRLAPDKPVVVDNLRRPVYVAAAHPGRRHGEDTHEHADVPPGQHRLLLGIECDELFRVQIKIINLPSHKCWICCDFLEILHE